MRPPGRGVRVEPVPELELAAEQAVVVAPRLQVPDVRLHAGQLPRQHLAVAVGDVHRPRHDRGGVRPAGAAERELAVAEDVGDDAGHGAVGGLVVREVDEPARPEGARVEQGARRGCEGLRVAGPAEPLVALRAVGRHGDEVVPLRPPDVLVEPGEVGVRAGEAPSDRGVAADGEDLGRHELRVA